MPSPVYRSVSFGALLWGLATLLACSGEPTAGAFRLVDVTAESGLSRFRHAGGREDKAYLPDTMGSGLCAIDYDGDGDDDLYLVNGNDPDALEDLPRDALYRNDGGRFVDVTDQAGLGSTGWGQGCAVGDPDGDGDLDLYVTQLMEPDLYYRNDGGRFVDATDASGLGDAGWGTGAVFFDLEGDGDEDLWVTRYVRYGWDPELAGFPCSWRGLQVACGPRGLAAEGDLLYCNEGGGRFRDCRGDRLEDVPEPAYGLGTLAADLDGDGDIDLFVANDATPNHFWENTGGKLRERGEALGLARNAAGEEEAGMGVALAGRDLYVTNFSLETDTLYRPLARGGFRDATAEAGLEAPTRALLSWGAVAFDPDLDGDLDLYVATGHIYPQVEGAPDLGLTYRQRDLFLRNMGGGRFRADPAVLEGGAPSLGRGVVVLDLEGDGDPDLVVSNLDGPPTVLRAEGAEGRASRLEIEAGKGGSYLSSHGRAPRGVSVP